MPPSSNPKTSAPPRSVSHPTTNATRPRPIHTAPGASVARHVPLDVVVCVRRGLSSPAAVDDSTSPKTSSTPTVAAH